MVRASRAERDVLPKLMLAGVAPLSLGVVNDVLFAQGIVQTAYIAHYGLSGFIVFQSLLLAVANARARRQSEVAAQELTTLNEELRRQIGDRSHQLAQTLTLLASDVRRVSELKPGTIMAERYRIEHLLGAGGMGAVYAAVRLPDDKPVALKVVRLSASPSMLARFAREAEAAAKVNHPNVVGILDVEISDDGELFIVMERIIGRSLDELRGRFGNPGWAIPLLQQLAEALEAIHAAEVIHRDLKPANILLTEGGVLKVADFGIAGLRTDGSGNSGDSEHATRADRPSVRKGDSGHEADSVSDALTQAGTVLGSPMYMSPEAQKGAQHTGAHSDLYSFGVVAYEMLSARRPLTDGLAAEQGPLPLAIACPGVPAPLAEIIDACLKIDPAGRPTAAEVRAVLAQEPVARSRVG
jgi:serine/threonine-protein kinase